MRTGRFRRGWELTKKSWALLRGNPGLLRFPIVGAVLAIICFAVLGLPGLYLIDTERYAAGVPLLAVGIYLAVAVGVYYGVALAAATDALFRGETAYAEQGHRIARTRRGPIAGWALVSAILGTLLAVIESQRGLAQIVGMLVGAAWGLVTFLAVPVIAIEGLGPFATIKRSAGLFKQRWAGQITGNVAIGGIIGLLAILPSILVIAAGIYLWFGDPNGDGIALGAVLVAVGGIVLVVAALVQRALRGVFGVALYRYAADGTPSPGFTQDDLESAVRTRG